MLILYTSRNLGNMRVDDSNSFRGSPLRIKQDREFPCGRGYDSCFHCRGLGSILGFETKILQATGMVQTRKKKARDKAGHILYMYIYIHIYMQKLITVLMVD